MIEGSRRERYGPVGRGLRGRFKDWTIRAALRLVFGAYLRVRVEGGDDLPPSGYVVCFNHPSWSDPLLLLAWWPDRPRRFWIFGPREHDMAIGRRNALIRWSERGIAFQPGGSDILDVTRRVRSVLQGGDVLAIAGEGRLSDREGVALPLEVGLGHFAMLAGVPIVPVAVVGTRWLHLGKTVRIRIGEPVPLTDLPSGRRGAAELTARVQAALVRLLEGAREEPPPGRFGRWISETFNERPWLSDQTGLPPGRRLNGGAAGARGSARRRSRSDEPPRG